MVKTPKHPITIGKSEPESASADASKKPAQHSAEAAQPPFNFANHFLIAMPSMLDPVFSGSVVFLCEHNAEGALGLIINKPTDMTVGTLFERIDLPLQNLAPEEHEHEHEFAESHKSLQKQPVMFGGPVQVERGFVLHMPPGVHSSMIKVSDEVALTTSKDILEEVSINQGPKQLVITLGCAGWGAGQLEDEITRNGWLTVAATPEIMFDTPVDERFAAALKLLGVDAMMLSGQAGHA